MCDIDEPVMVNEHPKPARESCIKCKIAPSIVVIRHAMYCKSVFQLYYIYSDHPPSGPVFFSPLSASSAPSSANPNFAKEGERVLLAFSGGPSSRYLSIPLTSTSLPFHSPFYRAMLHLLSEFQYVAPHETSKRQLFGGVTVCHVDESALFGPQEGTLERVEAVVREGYPRMPFVGVRMEDIFGKEYTESGEFEKVIKAVDNTGDKDGEIPHIYIILGTPYIPRRRVTNTRFLRLKCRPPHPPLLQSHHSHRQRIFVLPSEAQPPRSNRPTCTRLFLGDTSTRLAIRTISLTAKGRGYSLPLDVAVEDAVSVPGVVVLRPMKDMLAKEVGVYNRWKELENGVVVTKSWATGAEPRNSIERLTEEFIVGLDRDFPSTVSTITRTASKLTPAEDMDFEKTCALCLKPIQLHTKSWRQRITVTTVPSTISSLPSTHLPRPSDTTDLTELICYSCQVDLRDTRREEGAVMFPPYLAERVEAGRTREERLEEMRRQVEGFLLEG
ncbi:LOW QUALITY PROTEIN: hypothetical protein BC937DRAFT_89955 [Endogone sp. FLAS-F59071]|nr:LOW QUALITY PROTEIN: hypothetical protein BC937DRAFT_89955 [Endogone sp. FLAS-F59071]|eukprot:RUS22228.1 LOW QUALITY PROTEIN: hypothetical protein BC937DRAFT_89955 [Endogone sp. FLAS-F59071]